MAGKVRIGLIAVALVGLIFAFLAVSGCSGGSGWQGGGARNATAKWAAALESGDQTQFSSLYATDYSFDGVTRDSESGAGAPCPGFMGRDGETTVEVVEVQQNGDTAVAKVKVTYTAILGALEGDDTGSGGWGDEGADGTAKSFVDPGVSPAGPPEAAGPDADAQASGDRVGPAFALHAVRGEQVDTTPLVFTALYELNLDLIDGVWLVSALRQIWTELVVGNGAQAPTIETLLGDGSEEPTVDPRSEVEVAGTVLHVTQTEVACRVGYIETAMQVEGGAWSGSIRAPRAPGGYALEVRAVNESADGLAYGISTRSIPLTVRDVPGAGFSFSTATDVSLEAGVGELLEDLTLDIYNGDIEGATQYVNPAYGYDGGEASSALWSLPIAWYYDSDLAVTVTAATSGGGRDVVTVHFRQEADNYWSYGEVDTNTSDGAGTEPTAPPHLARRGLSAARARGTYGVETMLNEGDIDIELTSAGGGYLVSAIRPLWIRTTTGEPDELDIEALTGNGSKSPSVVGGSTLTIAGTVVGTAEWLCLSNYESSAYLSEMTGAFTADLVSPFARGRWLTWATAGAWSESGSVYLIRTLEVTVTSDAPTPSFTTASGVDVDSADVATLDTWLAGLFLCSSDRLGEAYSPEYSYDGRSYRDVIAQPRLYAYHAAFEKAEIVGIQGAAITLELDFLGLDQWFGVPYYGDGGETEPQASSARSSDRSGTDPDFSASRTQLNMTLTLDAAHLIVAERINTGVCAPDGVTAPALSDLRIDGAAPLSLAAGSEVTLSATALGEVGEVTGRIGPSQSWGQFTPSITLQAPSTPGRYLAEIVTGPAYAVDGTTTDMLGSAIIGAEVTVR